MRGRLTVAFGLLVVLFVLPTAPVAAQTLGDIEVLTRDGRIAQAREALTGWWDEGWSDASREQRQQALWLRGVLTLDPTQAASQFRRLTIQYPGGPWTARALLRLARAALLEDDVLTAARYFEDLRRDYPASAARLEAVEWLDENGALVESARAEEAVRQAEEEDRPEESPPPAAAADDAVEMLEASPSPAAEAPEPPAPIGGLRSPAGGPSPPSNGRRRSQPTHGTRASIPASFGCRTRDWCGYGSGSSRMPTRPKTCMIEWSRRDSTPPSFRM